jgi:hypothetical protein
MSDDFFKQRNGWLLLAVRPGIVGNAMPLHDVRGDGRTGLEQTDAGTVGMTADSAGPIADLH